MSTASSPRHTSQTKLRVATVAITFGAISGLGLTVANLTGETPAQATEVSTAGFTTQADGGEATQPEPFSQSSEVAARFLLTGVAGVHPLQEALDESTEDAAVAAAEAWHVPVSTYYISSPFGEMRYSGPHIGLDFAGNNGKPVVAARHGVVTQAGWEGGYGFAVTIDHRDGHSTKYAHLAQQPLVTVGQEVVGGQEIGYVGSTGDSTGPHLHFELLSFGQRIDPYLVINIPPSQGLAAS